MLQQEEVQVKDENDTSLLKFHCLLMPKKCINICDKILYTDPGYPNLNPNDIKEMCYTNCYATNVKCTTFNDIMTCVYDNNDSQIYSYSEK